jgi:hypothetical protein
MYIDPDGELAWFIPVIIGAVAGGIAGWQTGKAKGAEGGAMVGYILGGAAIGAISAGIGTAVSTTVSTSLATVGIGGFAGGAISGAASGLTAGAFGGFGMGTLAGKIGNDLWKSTWKGGLIGMGSGALIGGLWGGIDAKLDGRRFWDGATVERMVLAEQNIPIVAQEGRMNCGPASAEAIDRSLGGNMTQAQIRNLPEIGGDPITTHVDDIAFWKAYSNASGRILGAEAPCPSVASPSNVLSTMQNGGRVAINLNMGGDIGHGVVMQRVVQKTITRINGNVVQKLIYNVMNPDGGYYMRISRGSIINAHNIFYIF